MTAVIVTSSTDRFNDIMSINGLSKAKLVLWKPDFTAVVNALSDQPDSLGEGVDLKVLRDATKDIHDTLGSWHCDEFGEDLSLINGCSLGAVFASSSELLFYNVAQCFLEFKNFIEHYDQIFIDSSGDPVKEFVARWMEKNNYGGFKIVNPNLNECNSDELFVHPMTLLRDLKHHFLGSFKDSLVGFLLKWVQPKHKKNILILDAGKFEGYLTFREDDRPRSFSILTPIRRNWKVALGHSVFWQRTGTNRSYKEVTLALEKIKEKGWGGGTRVIPTGLFQEATQRFILTHWCPAFSYFRYYNALLGSFKSKLVVLASDKSEIPLIVAFAAKKNAIPVAVMPHGIEPFLQSKDLDTPSRLFTNYLSIGAYDLQKFIDSGLPRERILDIQLPWFTQKKLVGKSSNNNVRDRPRAMLLPLDTGFSLELSAGSVVRHLYDMIKVCDLCDIDVFGIKFRSEREAHAFGLCVGENNIFGIVIEVYAGYGTLSDYFKDVDLIIGPFNSGTAECALANIDYYSFHDFGMYSENPNIFYNSVNYIYYVASTAEELQENITNRRTFKDGHDATSLVSTGESFAEACLDLDRIFEQCMT